MTRPLFHLLGIPVTVSAWHLLLLVFIFQWGFQLGPAFGIGLVLIGSFSTLMHEMGHGMVSHYLGLEPEVVLTGFGGYCRHQPAKRPLHEFLIVAAGPTANFVLAIAFHAASFGLADSAALLCQQAAVINVFWGAYNLLPILPLDGGALLRTVLRKLMRKSVEADRWTCRVGLVLGGGLAVLVLALWHSIFAGLILGLAALENWRMLKALDEEPDVLADQKHARVRELLQEAHGAFERNDYEAAMRFCHQARAEPWLSADEQRHIWHVLAISAARLGEWEEALRYAERVPESADMALVQAAALLALADGGRARRFMASSAALLLPEDRVAALKDLARA